MAARSATACSAAATVLAVGALTTRHPASVAAWRSTLSIPTPARPTTRSRPRAASNTSRVTRVALRTTNASTSDTLARSSSAVSS
uniref:Si707066f01 n=1 Tax=Arundo donax TaxID=35708 RepID=A0A0A9F0C1_ARUDO